MPSNTNVGSSSATARDEARLLGFLQDLVRTESTPGRESAVVKRVVDEMLALGYDDVFVDEAGNAVGRLGHGSPVILVDCHVDTIPLHSIGSWTHDPLGGEVEDGRLYGLGSCDMKASAAAAIHGVASIATRRDELTGTVYVVSSVAEEMMEGATLAHTLEALDPDTVVIGEPTDLRLSIGQRGRAKIEVDVIGRASHAGHPSLGINAAERMAELITAVASLDHPTHPVLGTRSITCIDVRSEPYPSVSTVPERCRARFDCRFGPEDTQDSLLTLLGSQDRVWNHLKRKPRLDCRVYTAEFETYNGRRYSIPEFAAAWRTPEDSPLVQRCLAGLKGVGIPPKTSTYAFCTNGSLTAGERGVPTVGFGVGKEDDAHSVNESVALSSLFAGARGYAALVSTLLSRNAGAALTV